MAGIACSGFLELSRRRPSSSMSKKPPPVDVSLGPAAPWLGSARCFPACALALTAQGDDGRSGTADISEAVRATAQYPQNAVEHGSHILARTPSPVGASPRAKSVRSVATRHH